MKKGFTLVELLAVIIIIGVVALIAVPSVMKSIDQSKEKSYSIQVENIEISSKKWATDNIDELDSEYLNSSFVSVNMLRDLGYLAKDKIKNPKTGEEMQGCVKVAYDSASKTYAYTYDDSNTDCTNRNENGYYYQKDTDENWKRDDSNKRESIYSFLLGEDNSNVVVSGSGLYDMEDRYVFRGNVTNNYVKINNISYKILNLDKNTKSLKLISVESNGSAVWGKTDKIDFNVSTLYTEHINKSLYPDITNTNIKWNIGKIENVDGINMDAARTYESKTKIVSELGLISMSEYMEASINVDCSNGSLASCSLDTYLSMSDAWTSTTTLDSAVYVDSTMGLAYESDLENAHHNIYRTFNIKNEELKGTGTISDPFIISVKESE